MNQSSFSERLRKLELKHFLVIFIAFIILFGALYGIYTYRQEQLKPVEIIITSPAQGGGTYQSETLIIEGQTRKNTSVRINGIETISDREGRFTVEVPIQVGENTIKIQAGEGEELATTTVVVYREAPIAKDLPKTSDIPVVTEQGLNNTGPETLWLGEIALISGSAMLYFLMKKRFKKATRKATS
jgi:hypothetical protein